jgi:hypothetical protein
MTKEQIGLGWEGTYSFCASTITNVLSLTLAVDGGTPTSWRKDFTCVADAIVSAIVARHRSYGVAEGGRYGIVEGLGGGIDCCKEDIWEKVR